MRKLSAGSQAILPYKILFILMHFAGAIFAFSTVWTLGDVALGLVTFPQSDRTGIALRQRESAHPKLFRAQALAFPTSKLDRMMHKLSTAVPLAFI